MQVLSALAAFGGAMVAAGAGILFASEPDMPRALLMAAAALLCPLALVGSGARPL